MALFYAGKAKGNQQVSPALHMNKAKEDFFRRVLPILDGFDNIFQFAQNSNVEENETLANWIRTLDTLYRRLQTTMEKEGLVAIESVGKPVDFSLHEVVNTREDTEAPDNMIVEEVVKGYQFGRRVLRDAKVIVAKKAK